MTIINSIEPLRTLIPCCASSQLPANSDFGAREAGRLNTTLQKTKMEPELWISVLFERPLFGPECADDWRLASDMRALKSAMQHSPGFESRSP